MADDPNVKHEEAVHSLANIVLHAVLLRYKALAAHENAPVERDGMVPGTADATIWADYLLSEAQLAFHEAVQTNPDGTPSPLSELTFGAWRERNQFPPIDLAVVDKIVDDETRQAEALMTAAGADRAVDAAMRSAEASERLAELTSSVSMCAMAKGAGLSKEICDRLERRVRVLLQQDVTSMPPIGLVPSPDAQGATLVGFGGGRVAVESGVCPDCGGPLFACVDDPKAFQHAQGSKCGNADKRYERSSTFTPQATAPTKTA